MKKEKNRQLQIRGSFDYAIHDKTVNGSAQDDVRLGWVRLGWVRKRTTAKTKCRFLGCVAQNEWWVGLSGVSKLGLFAVSTGRRGFRWPCSRLRISGFRFRGRL